MYNQKMITGLSALMLSFAPCSISGLFANEVDNRGPSLEHLAGEWQDFHATSGQCSVRLPASPEHVSEQIKMPDGQYELKYDAYISEYNKSSVYMLLVAQYPDFVDASYAQSSLEGFLNGILSYNPANQLIFADLSLVNGHEALDFFIRAGAVYFKGRAILVKNSLYLMAMECEVQDYDENKFNMFINSFSLKN